MARSFACVAIPHPWVVAFALGVAAVARASITVVSQAALPADTASGESGAATFSGDGHFVFFLSEAANLAANDLNGARVELFRRELVSGTTIPVSTPANARTTGFSVSADGRWVAFVSRASNLVAGENQGRAKIYVRDLQTGQIRLISARGPAAVRTGVVAIGAVVGLRTGGRTRELVQPRHITESTDPMPVRGWMIGGQREPG